MSSLIMTVLILPCLPGFSFASDQDAGKLITEGKRLSDNGDFRQAVISFEEAKKLLGKTASAGEMIEVGILTASALHYLSRDAEAFDILESSLPLSLAPELKAQRSRILSLLGSLYGTDRRPEAEALLKEALDLAKSTKSEELIASALNSSGNMHLKSNEHEKASAAYREALVHADRDGGRMLRASVMNNLGSSLLLSGRTEEAAAVLDEAFKLYWASEDSFLKTRGLLNIGKHRRELAIRTGKNAHADGAQNAFTAASLSAQNTGDAASLSYANGYLGQLHEDSGRLDQALGYTRQAVFDAQKSGVLQSLYLWQWQTARIFEKKGKLDEAIMSYRDAVRSLQDIRQGSSGCKSCAHSDFRTSVQPVYFGLADLLLRRSAEHTGRKEYEPYLIEARETIELLKAAELRDYFQDDCVDAYQAKMTRLDAVSDHTAIIYIIPFPERLELLLSLPSGMNRFSVSVTSDRFAEEVNMFRQKLEKRSTRQYMAHSRQLFEWIMRPLIPHLAEQKVTTLVFVPDGVLRTVPMAALHDGSNFLVDSFAIAVTPGLTLTDPHALDRTGMNMIMSGISRSVQGFPDLANVPRELDGVKNIYGGRVILDQEFVIPEMKKELGENQYSVVHIASHGEFTGDMRETFLLSWDGRITFDQLDTLLRPSRFREKPVELLALSACQSASGDDRAALGLAGIAIKAGARSALATLWNVSDEASSRLVVDFYGNLQEASLSKAEALRKAQSALLSDRKFRHPMYWSPFLIIGNWL